MNEECPSFFDLFIGDDLQSQLLGVEENGDPVNLSGVTDIQISFPNDPKANQTSPTYTASLINGQIAVSDAPLGKFSLSIPNTVTQYFLALIGFDIDIVVIFTVSSLPVKTTYRIPAGCNIKNRSYVQYSS